MGLICIVSVFRYLAEKYLHQLNSEEEEEQQSFQIGTGNF